MAAETQEPVVPPMESAFNLINPSIELVKRNWKAFAVVSILSILSALIGIFGSESSTTNQTTDSESAAFDVFSGLSGVELGGFVAAGLAVALIVLLIAMFLQVMTTSLEVKASMGEKPSIKELTEDGKKYYWRMFGLVLVMTLIVTAGLLLLIVPGIIAFGRLVLAPYFLIDKDMGIKEALKASNEIAKENSNKVWGAIGVAVLIGLGIGLLSMIPILGEIAAVVIGILTSLVIPLRYQQLKNQPAVEQASVQA